MDIKIVHTNEELKIIKAMEKLTVKFIKDVKKVGDERVYTEENIKSIKEKKTSAIKILDCYINSLRSTVDYFIDALVPTDEHNKFLEEVKIGLVMMRKLESDKNLSELANKMAKSLRDLTKEV